MVVVAHFDRLARKGFDRFRRLCEQNGCELVVFNETSLCWECEVVEDILAILHCYCFAEASYRARLYGLRKYKAQVKKNPDLPKLGT
jgi:predicted site-specific integrase-resolvase